MRIIERKMLKEKIIIGIKVVVFVVMILITIKGAIGVTIGYDLVLNSTPQVQDIEVPINITLTPNGSIFLDLIKSDPRLNYTYPNQTFFNNTNFNMIRINISYAEIYDENISSLFKISNDLNNNSYLYNITLRFLPDNSVETVPESFINVMNGDYVINITTDLLPKSGDLDYEIAGLAGNLLNISCTGSWLSCPVNQTFDSNNKTTFKITYTIPVTAPLGTKINTVNLTTGNISVKQDIIFNVKEPDLRLKQYEFREECFVEQPDGSMTVTYDCILEQEQYNIKRLSIYLDYIRQQRNYTCEPEVINHTEYLIVGNIEEQVNEELERLRTDISTCVAEKEDLRIDKKEAEQEKNNWIQSYNNINEKLLKNETECLSTVFSTSVKLKADAEAIVEEGKLQLKEEKRKHYWTITWIIIIFVIVAGIGFYYKNLHKEAWGTW